MWFVDCYMEFKVTLFHGPFPWLLVACSILVLPVPVAANLIFFIIIIIIIFFFLIGEERPWGNFLTNDMRWTKPDTENVYIGVGGHWSIFHLCSSVGQRADTREVMSDHCLALR